MELRTTKDQIEEFKESILWADIVRELKSWRKGFKIEQESIVDNAADSNPSTASVLLHIGDINGRLKTVDYVLGILDMFLSIINLKLEGKENGIGRNEAD